MLGHSADNAGRPHSRELHVRAGWGVTGFDKAWTGLQRFFSDPGRTGHCAKRPAFDLVAGDVTYPNGYSDGYEPHVAVIGAAVVREIARDLAIVTDPDIREYAAAWEPYGYPADPASRSAMAMRVAAQPTPSRCVPAPVAPWCPSGPRLDRCKCPARRRSGE